MTKIKINVRHDLLDKLQRCALDNGRSLPFEIQVRVAESFCNEAMARRAKIAILASTFGDAAALARVHGWRRDQWFYAHSIESVTGRLVRRIEVHGTYRGRPHHDAMMKHLRAGEVAAQRYAVA